MKRLALFLMSILTLVLITACVGCGNETNSNVSPSSSSKQETVSSEDPASSDEQNDGASESEEPGNRVSAIVGGGDFNVGEDY